MSRIVPTVLNALLSEGRFSAEDLASMAGCSANMIYRVRNEESELSTSKLQRLCLALCEHGETRLSRCFLTPEFVVVRREDARANGRIDDEAADMMEAMGTAVAAFRSGDRTAMDDALAEAQRVLENARAERDRL